MVAVDTLTLRVTVDQVRNCVIKFAFVLVPPLASVKDESDCCCAFVLT